MGPEPTGFGSSAITWPTAIRKGSIQAWEAGGLKAALAEGLVLQDNVVERNDGPGLWCDIDCRDITIRGNRVTGNSRAGIHFEISDGADITDNVVVDNGWGFATWGWGAGILVSSSTGARVTGNTVAWNADGIAVVSQVRGRASGDTVRDVTVEGNTVIDDGTGGVLLGWLQDWSGAMYDAGAANHGRDNAFSSAGMVDCSFEWDGCHGSVEAFAETPGGAGSRSLTDDERSATLAEYGIAGAPAPHEVNDPPRLRTLVPWVVGGGVVVLLVGGLGIVAIRRRRTSRI